MSPQAINHVAVVVEDLEVALAFWQTALGIPLQRTEDNADEAVRIAFLPLGGSEIELLQPTTPDSGIAKYLDRRGPGLHHLCLAVDDIEATLQRLRDHQMELINETPRTRPDGTRYAFIHPREHRRGARRAV